MKTQFGKKLPTFLLTIILMLLYPVSLPAQTTAGVTFLRMSAGSRAQAMGNAYTAIAGNANGVHYNPAGMGFGLSRELMLYHSRWFQDISMENLTFYYPFTSRWGISSSVSYLHMAEFTRYDIDPLTGGPLENGTFSVYNIAAIAGIGYRITDNIALGTNLKFFQEKLELTTARGIAFDVGVLAKFPFPAFSFGFAVQNLGPPVKYEEHKETLPLTYRAGIAYRFSGPGTVAFDVTKTIGKKMQFLPGMEFGVTNALYLRGGYQVTEYEGSGMTAGFGLRLMDNHCINYVYMPYGDLGDTHHAELVLYLGSAPVEISSYNVSKNRSKSTDRAKSDLNNYTPAKKETELTPALPSTTQPGLIVVDKSPEKLVPPTGLKVDKVDSDKIKVSWNQAAIPGVVYNVYAKLRDGTRWIKLTHEPIEETDKIFTQKKSNIRLLFTVTAVRGAEESDFSMPIYFKLP
jgi:hypothetical protein